MFKFQYECAEVNGEVTSYIISDKTSKSVKLNISSSHQMDIYIILLKQIQHEDNYSNMR